MVTSIVKHRFKRQNRRKETSPSHLFQGSYQIICRVKQEAERRKREAKQKVVAEKKRVAVVKDGVGEFETHTKGVASRMMEKMG